MRIINKSKSKSVLAAMSGGVDSSMAAALLKAKGYYVIGVFFRLHNYFKESEEKAEKIAKKLNIDFYVFSYQKEFKEKIADYFIDANKKGLTPNPCVVCNKKIKFNLLFESLSKFKADYIATGHYVRKLAVKDKNSKIVYKLFKAKDSRKDQSYFLWQLNQKILQKTLFPIGDYQKDQVKKTAKKLGFSINGPESQEICFINGRAEAFLKKKIGVKKGNIVDKKGNILAEHKGLWFYTIGQRKKIKLSGGPYYVIEKDIKNNTLIVSKNEKDLLRGELKFKDSNWILGKKPKFPLEIEAKIRYHHKPAKAVAIDKNHLIFEKPQKAITPGQSVVFYHNSELLGGGVIQ